MRVVLQTFKICVHMIFWDVDLRFLKILLFTRLWFIMFSMRIDEEHGKSDNHQSSLAESFRKQAAMLVDMLDMTLPVVAKLKVSFYGCFIYIILYQKLC